MWCSKVSRVQVNFSSPYILPIIYMYLIFLENYSPGYPNFVFILCLEWLFSEMPHHSVIFFSVCITLAYLTVLCACMNMCMFVMLINCQLFAGLVSQLWPPQFRTFQIVNNKCTLNKRVNDYMSYQNHHADQT